MDRVITYPGEIPQDSDVLSTAKNGLLALARLAETVLGSGTLLDGLACTPGTGLTVSVGTGSIYSVGALDATNYGSLGSDATSILRQGLAVAPQVLSCPASGISGRSINYLIQFQHQYVDSGAVALPYYNSANPTVAWSGPGGTGTSQPTARLSRCVAAAKAGVSAPTGTQTTPTPDSGWTPGYVVTVTFGNTSIAAGSIAVHSSAPFITERLVDKLSLAAADARYGGLVANNIWTNANAFANGVNVGSSSSTPYLYESSANNFAIRTGLPGSYRYFNFGADGSMSALNGRVSSMGAIFYLPGTTGTPVLTYASAAGVARYYETHDNTAWTLNTANDDGSFGVTALTLTRATGALNAATGFTVGGSTAWHAGNDGASSGLDADLLDGQHGAYYTAIAARLGFTPANIANFVSSRGANGYFRLPMTDGVPIYVQWVTGALDTGGESTQPIAFPITFPTACLMVIPATQIASGSASSDNFYQLVGSPTPSNFTVQRQQTGGGSFGSSTPIAIAIGY